MADGRWQMADGKWRMADGRWRMADCRWQMADGGWRMADGGWRMADGRWQMADGRWQRTKDKGQRTKDKGNATMARADQANGEGKSKVQAHPADENIVRRVRADRDAKASDDKDPGEEHARHPAEYKGKPGERLTGRTRVVSQREE